MKSCSPCTSAPAGRSASSMPLRMPLYTRNGTTLCHSTQRGLGSPSLSTASSGSYKDISTLLSTKSDMVSTQLHDEKASFPNSDARVTAAPPVASISRIFLVGQPQNLFRNLANQRKWPSGPVQLLLFVFGLVLAAWAAVRAALIRRVRSCSSCRGYGITRCNLCAGEGKVDWRAKFSYSDSCPLCMSRRFIECPDCGGHYHRPLFSHASRSDILGRQG